jgi:ankyrin repeat protein
LTSLFYISKFKYNIILKNKLMKKLYLILLTFWQIWGSESFAEKFQSVKTGQCQLAQLPEDEIKSLAVLKDEGGNSFLQHAVSELDLPEIKKLLEARADVNDQGTSLDLPLIIAAQRSASPKALSGLMPLLLDYGANPHVVDKSPEQLSPLHYAARGGNLPDVCALLDSRVNPHQKTKSMEATALDSAITNYDDPVMVGTLLQACDKAACMRGVAAMEGTLRSAMSTAVKEKRPKSLQTILNFIALNQIPRPQLDASVMDTCPCNFKKIISGHDFITSCLDNINPESESTKNLAPLRQPEGIWLSERAIMGIVLLSIFGDDVD